MTTGQLPQKQVSADGGSPDTSPGAEAGAVLTPASLIAAPPDLEFDSVSVGQVSKEITVMLVNVGQETSGELSFAIENPEFAIQSPASRDCIRDKTRLRPNDSCAIRVTLSPASTGVRTGKLSFSATPGGSGVVDLSGTGTCGLDTLPDGTDHCVPMAGVEWVQRGPMLSWTSVASSADGKHLAAVADGGQIHTSSDAGVTWTARASAEPWWSVASSADGSRLVAASKSTTGGGHLSTSTDFGETWTTGASGFWCAVASAADGVSLFAMGGDTWPGPFNTSISTNGGSAWTITSPIEGTTYAYYRVATSSDGKKVIVSEGSRLRISVNGGNTWTTAGAGRQYWTGVAVSGDGSLLMAATQSTAGYIYLSRDAGATWSETGPAHPWISVASSSDGKYLIAAAEHLFQSTDSGKTWVQRASSRTWKGVASSADGTKLVAIASGDYIYTSTGRLP